MQDYKYELHAHTAEGSKCARIPAKELVRFYKSQGFDGICITDHFLNGNTTVPPELPWEKKVELFCRGYELARNEGEKIGISVFFGWEYSYHGTDFLTYGLDKDWLLGHPEVLDYSVNDYCDLARDCGGFIVHAHPFREAGYISMIRLLPRSVDAVEVVNACRTDFENERAGEYAENYRLLRSAGSDNHQGWLPRLCGMRFTERKGSLAEIIEGIKVGEGQVFTESVAKD